MNEHVRNRLVGGIILASLAVLFLPMLFDGAGIERRDVPPMPGGDPVADAPVEPVDPASEDWAFVEEAERRRTAPDGGGIEARPQTPPVTEEALDAEREPRLDASGLPVAFAVQVGVFAVEENAASLHERLIADGYEAYVDRLGEADAPRWRVAVGPRVDGSAARRLATEVSERYDVEALVTRFEIGSGAIAPAGAGEES